MMKNSLPKYQVKPHCRDLAIFLECLMFCVVSVFLLFKIKTEIIIQDTLR
jgi:hypothetical protein